MARFFKPLLSAVALAAAALTSTGALAAYNYNAQITITAPKGSTAELAAKDKTKPTGIKLSTCAAKITAVTPNIMNIDALSFSVKYDAGKDPAEIGDVYLLLENLAETPSAPAVRYVAISRASGLAVGGGLALTTYGNSTALNSATSAALKPFLAATDNLGSGAQTELLFGGPLNLTTLDKGLWAMHLIIAKPGTTLTGSGAYAASSFSFGHPETWAAYDTAVFALGTPLPLDTTAIAAGVANLVDYSATTGDVPGSVVCE